MNLDYLRSLEGSCDIEQLSLLNKERSQWLQRASSQSYWTLLQGLPLLKEPSQVDCSGPEIVIGCGADLDPKTTETIRKEALSLVPWKKGPFRLFGELIDGEWRSDLKWDRLKEHISPLKDRAILDVGCNNGYFMFRMAHHSPRLVLGIDPFLHCYVQYQFLQNFAKIQCLKYELFGAEELRYFHECFDTIFSMGVIYHRRSPLDHLTDIRHSLKRGGELVLETLGVPGTHATALTPKGRYLGMKNVWFIPTQSCVENWLHRARFSEIQLISETALTTTEQRLTSWCPPPRHSLADFLDPADPTKSVEGLPAPMRFLFIAKK